ncbi:hypothetical protein RJ640_003010 [Escallonia rubra]|uniref:TF-B3 domain-containing protein n=1 Tax=Escallonia rubra TaxID=112253 RepID=A0AA88R7Y9_9ASTE|nr:hypothetical protein RJ640_003010 [Escallonia rubra]
MAWLGFLVIACFRYCQPLVANVHRIPLSFLKHMSDETSGSVYLMGHSGNTWEVNLVKDNESLNFNKGWSAFVKDHFAELWDFFVFKYDGNSHFTVKVFDRSGCEKETAFPAKYSQGALKIVKKRPRRDSFVHDNDIREGDTCLFELVGQNEMLIHISRKKKEVQQLGPAKRSQAQKNRGVNLSAIKINQLLKKKARALSIAIAKCKDGFHFRKAGSESAYTQVSAMNLR